MPEKPRAFAVRSHGRHLHVGSPQSSLVGLADKTTHKVPWQFPLRHGGTSTRMHARVSVTIGTWSCSLTTVAMLKDMIYKFLSKLTSFLPI